MVNKKYLLLAGFCTALALQPAFAQESNTASWSGRDMTYRGQSYDALDAAYIPGSRMQQQRDYMDYKYAFPAKPRNMMELGISAGFQNIFGDVTSRMPWKGTGALNSLGFGASLRKAWGYATSWRLQYNFQNAQGIDYRARYAGSTAGSSWSAYAPGTAVFSNYKYTGHEITLQIVGALNNINFHRAKNTASLYGFVGAGALLHKTTVITTDASGALLDPANTHGVMDKTQQDAYRETLKAAKDKAVIYRRNNQTGNGNSKNDTTKDFRLSPVLVGGVGVQFKLGNRVSLQIEDKVSWTGLDYLDATEADPGMLKSNGDKDIINYGSVGLGFNLGSAKKSVAPLWWVNPMDHIYNELATPRHMKLPDPVLPDTDGDGVTDQFDKCPDTPAGVAVDTHGCPLDTDGDGVPDYRDKQLITPTECQPVNADGVGKCPCPDASCFPKGPVASCANIMGGSLSVTAGKNGASLSSSAKSQLSTLAAQMRSNPDCVVVIAADGSKKTGFNPHLSVEAVINYMESQNISRGRFDVQVNDQNRSGDSKAVRFYAR